MSKLKYAVTYKGESDIQAGFQDSEEAAIEEFNRISDEPFDPAENIVQCFTGKEVREIEAYSEAHPQ